MVDCRTELENLYFGNMDILAREYGCYADIVTYGEETHENYGRYLVLAPNREIIDDAKSGHLAIDSQLRLQADGQVYTNMKIIKLDESNMSVARIDAQKWLSDYELLKCTFVEKNLPIPFRVRPAEVEMIKEFNKNRRSSAYEDTDEFIDKCFGKFLKGMSKRLEKEESFSAIFNKNRKQEVNKDTLIDKTESTYTFAIDKDIFPAWKEYIKKEPNCLYCVCKESKYKTFDVENLGLQSGYKEEEQVTLRIMIDGIYRDLVSEFFTKRYAEKGIQTSDIETLKQIRRENPGVEFTSFAVPNDSNVMINLYNACVEQRIPFALDINSEFKKHDVENVLNIVVFADDKEKLNQILKGIIENNERTYGNRHEITTKQKAKAEEVETKPQKKKLFGFV